ncbi:MAG: hypothetical protein ACOCRZ_06185 [Halothermotrichaceae bacterium]
MCQFTARVYSSRNNNSLGIKVEHPFKVIHFYVGQDADINIEEIDRKWTGIIIRDNMTIKWDNGYQIIEERQKYLERDEKEVIKKFTQFLKKFEDVKSLKEFLREDMEKYWL